MNNTPKVPKSQAERVYAKFGGARQLFNALGKLADDTGNETHRRDRVAIYRWNMTKAQGGTDGYIPAKVMPSIKLAARREGILLTPEDTCP